MTEPIETKNDQPPPPGRARTDSPRRTWWQGVLILLALALGIAFFLNLIDAEKPTESTGRKTEEPIVHVRVAKAGEVQTEMHGRGVVGPKVAVEIVSEVPGKVVFVHSGLKAGCTIPAHERIIQIDPREYQLAVQQASAAVAEAQARLDIEVAEADLARSQWRRQHPESEPSSSLILREPQIRQARAALKGAQAQLAQAQLRLERTSISLPYDVLIVEENIDLGGYAEVGHKLAVAYGIDAFEVEVSFGDDGWAGVDLLGDTNSVAEAADEDLPEVDVEARIAGGLHRWIGYVARMAGQGDPTSGDVPAVIDVPRPLDGAPGRPPLLPGMIVEATMPGRTLTGVIAVPHSAIDDQNRVWTVVDGRLHSVSAGMAWSDEDFSYVTTGIPDGTVIALDFPCGACEGMPVRVVGEAASADEP